MKNNLLRPFPYRIRILVKYVSCFLNTVAMSEMFEQIRVFQKNCLLSICTTFSEIQVRAILLKYRNEGYNYVNSVTLPSYIAELSEDVATEYNKYAVYFV